MRKQRPGQTKEFWVVVFAWVDAWSARVNRYEEIVNECHNQAQLYEQVWIRGSPAFEPDVDSETARADELTQLKDAFVKTERARRATVKKAPRTKK